LWHPEPRKQSYRLRDERHRRAAQGAGSPGRLWSGSTNADSIDVELVRREREFELFAVAGGTGTGLVNVWASDATDVILDASGYFVQVSPTNYYLTAMLYTPVTPCRLIDTRNSPGALGGLPLVEG
jgi:hypothetical protein